MRDDGIKYEEFCCRYLQEKGYSTRTTVASGDQGADIIAEKDSIRIAVQCKYRTEGSVGNDAIQQANAGKQYYDCDVAMVITNVDFTPKALDAAKKLKVKILPRVRMIEENQNSFSANTNLDNKSHHKSANNNSVILKENATVNPFLFGVSDVLADLDEKVNYGKCLLNREFKIDYPFFDQEYEDLVKTNVSFKPYETEYLKGLGHAQKLLEIINEFNAAKFNIVDWFFSIDRDKNIFVFETIEKISESFPRSLQNELVRLFGLEVEVTCSDNQFIVISIINRDTTISRSTGELLRFVSDFIHEHVSRSIISIDSKDPLLKHEKIEKYSFEDDSGEKETDYSAFYLFTCKEFIDDKTLSSLEAKAVEFFRRRLLIKKTDSHSFVLCIKKIIGMDDFLSVIDVRDFRGHDLSGLISVIAGKCADCIEFSVKLKNISISRYNELIVDDLSKATVIAYLEQLRYLILGLYDLTMINMVKERKIDIPLLIRNKAFYVEGIAAEEIHVKVLDANNRVVFYEEVNMNPSNGFSSFPISNLYHDNFVNTSFCYGSANIGLNAMMIQKTLKDFPQLAKTIGNYYIIDTLKKKTDEYVSILDKYFPVFFDVYDKLKNCKTSDDYVCIKNEEEKYKEYYFSSTKDVISENLETDSTICKSIRNDYHFWNSVRDISRRELVWGCSLPRQTFHIDSEIKKFIEEFLTQKNIKFKYLDQEHSGDNSYCFEIHGTINPITLAEEINASIPEETESTIYSGGCFFIYKKMYNSYVIVWDTYGKCFFKYAYLSLQNLKNTKSNMPLSFWMIDTAIKPYCVFQSFCDSRNEESDIALLAIKLKNVSIKDLVPFFRDDSESSKKLWGAWNDMLYSLLSLYLLLIKTNRDLNKRSFNAEIELYDKNNMMLADLLDGEIKFSYFHTYEIMPFYKNFSKFGSIDSKDCELFKKDIIPILNNTLRNAIKTLEESKRLITRCL